MLLKRFLRDDCEKKVIAYTHTKLWRCHNSATITCGTRARETQAKKQKKSFSINKSENLIEKKWAAKKEERMEHHKLWGS